MRKYQIREVDYPYKGYFAEFRFIWMWWPMHISMRPTKAECEDIIERDKKAWI
jgi:hypothetical protein